MKTEEEIKELTRQIEEEGKTIQEVLHLGAADLEEVYRLGYGHYMRGEYREALKLFHLLHRMRPQESRFIFAAGTVSYDLREYREAALAFSLAAILAPSEPLAAFHAAEAFLRCGEETTAEELFQVAVERAGESKEFEGLKERYKLVKNRGK